MTDYCVVDSYERVLAHKIAGRLPDVRLLFPNIELRFGIGTNRGNAINVHLLVSPDDADHVAQLKRFLASLTFRYAGTLFRCEPDGLRALGRKHDPAVTDYDAALKAGANLFKVMPETVAEAFDQDRWAQKNIIIGVAGGSTDGSSGLQDDASFAALRREIERMSSVIFSSQPSQREFWLGRKALNSDQLEDLYGGRKVCLHGCDAHKLDDVAEPNLKRYTWIKGDPTFDSLRQACIEPGTRAVVGMAPPEGAHPYQIIESFDSEVAPWCETPHIELNAGLVGIIGARGSGKTALADLIAFTGRSDEPMGNERSFLRRASQHLRGSTYSLNWVEGEADSRSIGDEGSSDVFAPRVQYLSQQFVERLCSSDGITDELLSEIERVVFDAHPIEGRLGAVDFQELLGIKASRGRELRRRCEDQIAELASRVNVENGKQAALPTLRRRHEAGVVAHRRDLAAREGLMKQADQGDRAQLDRITSVVEERQKNLDLLARERESVSGLRESVRDSRDRVAPAELIRLKHAHSHLRLEESDWERFLRVFAGDVDALISEREQTIQVSIDRLTIPNGDAGSSQPDSQPLAADADLTQCSLMKLRSEAERLRGLIGLDNRKSESLHVLNDRIAQSEAALARIAGEIEDAENARAKISELNENQRNEYARIFEAIEDEESQLRSLYEPLRELLDDEIGVLERLEFSVRRVVDVETWAERGEDLLDLRTTGTFRGHGALLYVARHELQQVWETGTSTEVADAMSSFRSRHRPALLEHSPVAREKQAEYWAWGSQISSWLTSTDHISVRYGIEYDGIDIEQLSPGTRGHCTSFALPIVRSQRGSATHHRSAGRKSRPEINLR